MRDKTLGILTDSQQIGSLVGAEPLGIGSALRAPRPHAFGLFNESYYAPIVVVVGYLLNAVYALLQDVMPPSARFERTNRTIQRYKEEHPAVRSEAQNMVFEARRQHRCGICGRVPAAAAA